MELLNASSFFIAHRNVSAVRYITKFGIGFQALSSRSSMVAVFMRFSHGGFHVFLDWR